MVDDTIQKLKKRRASVPRNKTGCGTCKIRHKRCDEGKPVCDNCRKTGRICDGYIDPVTGQQLGGDARRHSPTGSPTPNLPLQPHFASQDEAQGFRYFEIATGIQLAAAAQYSGWTAPLLQLGHQNTAIRHAIIAVGIMSRRFQASGLSVSQSGQASALNHAALLQYGKAVAVFRSQLGTGLAYTSQPLEHAPVCCVLLILFEFLQGNVDGVLIHLKNATRLVASIGTNPQTRSVTSLLSMMDMVVVVWLNLDRACSDNTLQFHRLQTLPLPQPRGYDLANLGRVLVDIRNDMMTLRHATAVSQQRKAHGPSDFVEAKNTILCRLDLWYSAFVEACSTNEHGNGHRRSLLRAHYLLSVLAVDELCMSALSADTVHNHSEVDVPNLQHCSEILSLVEKALAMNYHSSRYDVTSGDETLEPAGLLPLFSFRPSFIEPAFYVAQKAPSLALRCRAIRILVERPWREGAWDSSTMGHIAKRSLEGSFATQDDVYIESHKLIIV